MGLGEAPELSRRAPPRPRRAEELRIRVLGSFSIEGIATAALGSRKERTLAKVLALARGRPVSANAIIDALWGDEPPARPHDQLTVLVSRLRSVVGGDRLVREPSGYRLIVSWLDLDAMVELVADAERRLRENQPVAARAAAQAAIALAGPLLPDELDAPWTQADRGLAVRIQGRAYVAASEAALAAGEPAAAIEHAEQALIHDPFDEVALRVVMRAQAIAGRPGAALAAYARVKGQLGEELGIAPDPATEAIHDAIVLGTPATWSRDDAAAAAGASPLFGRDDALAALATELGRAADGVRIVVVEGDAGMGKTALVDAWIASLPPGRAVLRGRCDELGRSLPLQAVLDAVSGYLGGLGREAARDALGADGPILGPLLGAPGLVADGTSPLPPGPEGQAQLFNALLGLLDRVRGDGPVIVTIDDVHFADDALIEWLHFVSRRAASLPMLLVVCRRPRLGRPLPDGRVILLAPLDLPSVVAMAGPDRASELLARSGGNPLLVVELAGTTPREVLPATLVEAVARRVELTGSSASTLRAAAVLGPDIDLDLLSSVLAVAPLTVLADLEVGVVHGFLVERNASFEFAHGLVREATQQRVAPARRALLHREAARVLASRSSSDPVIVAHHARQAGDTALAASALARAAGIAARRFDLGEAERLADTAVSLDDTASTRIVRGRIRLAGGRLEGARLDAMSALGAGGGAPALELAGWAAYYLREFTVAREAADDGVRLASDPEVAVGCLMLGGRVRHAAGDLAGAEPLLVAATESAEGANRAVAAVWLGALRIHQGDAEAALGLVRPATVPGAGSAHHAAVPHAWMHRAQALALLGRPAAALAALDELDKEVRRRGLESFRGRSDNFRAWILRNLGLASEAGEANERGVAAGRSIGMPEPQAQGLVDLADARLRGGDPDGCRAVLAGVQALQSVEHAFRWRHVLRARLLRTRADLASGQAEAALAGAVSVAQEAERIGVERYSVAAQLAGARARLALGEPVDREAVDRLLRVLDRVAAPEAWWMTAEMAAVFSEERWWAWADARLASWTLHAGDRVDEARRAAGAELGRLRRSLPGTSSG